MIFSILFWKFVPNTQFYETLFVSFLKTLHALLTTFDMSCRWCFLAYIVSCKYVLFAYLWSKASMAVFKVCDYVFYFLLCSQLLPFASGLFKALNIATSTLKTATFCIYEQYDTVPWYSTYVKLHFSGQNQNVALKKVYELLPKVQTNFL